MSSIKVNGEDSLAKKVESELLSRVFDGDSAQTNKKGFKKSSFLSMAKSVGLKLGFTGILFTGVAIGVGAYYTAKHTSTAFVASGVMNKHVYNAVPKGEIESFKKLEIDKLQPIKEVMEPEFNKVMADGKMTYEEKHMLEEKLTLVTKKLYGSAFANENTPLLADKNKNKPK